MGDRAAKDALFDVFAEVAKALGNGRRAELIDVLVQGERHVDELAAEIGQSVANTSFHLRVLATSGLVATRRDGTRIYYRVASERVVELWVALRDVASAHHRQLDELAAAYLGDRSRLDEIGRGELAQRIADGDVVVVDVRPAAEYASGHIAGRDRSRSTSSRVRCGRSLTRSRSSPTAEGLIACSRTMRCGCCADGVGLRGDWRTASPNGERPHSPSTRRNHDGTATSRRGFVHDATRRSEIARAEGLPSGPVNVR